MSIKVYNEVTGQWEVKATNQAVEVELDDVTGTLESDDVEGAIAEVIDRVDDVELQVYDIAKQASRTDKKVNSIIEEFQYHLENHPSGGGGGGDGVMPTITSTFEDNTVIDKTTKLYVPIFFSSGNLGNGTAYIVVNNIEIGSQTVKQGSNNIEVGIMPSQLNTVAIYVKDRGGLLSNQLSWTVICGGIEVSTTFDFEADYPMGETLIMPFNITTQSTDKIIMYLTVDQDIYMLDCVNGYNEYKFKELGVGIHKISFYVESGKYLTETYSYNLVIVDSNNLYVSTTFESGQEIAFGKLISINYRVSKASTENFTVNLYMDGKLEKTQTAPAGSYYWTITRLPIGEHTFKIEATGVQGDYAFIESTFTVVEGVYTPIEPVTGGLIAYFTAKNKTNQDDNKEIWTDESGNGVVATLHNFNYGNNGWMGDYLQCSGDSYVEIDMQPYLDNVKQGSTIDIHFNMTSVGVEEARVLDYTEIETPNKGIYIDTMETKLVSETSTGLVKLDENTDTRLTYVVDRQNRLAIIYLNGVINRVFPLSDTGTGVNATFEDFSHKEKIYLNSRKGQDLFADCKIYSLRVYNRALSHEEVLQNHIADIDDLNEQEKFYNKNYANYDIPEIRMYGDTTNMTGEIFQTMRIKYTSPNEDLYGQSFDTMYNQVRWQGTSSQQYDMKNYQVYLKDNNMADMYYTPFANGIPEHIFCFKCNYMESSHMNNTGIATFANDCVFTTPNPAQAKNPLVRNSINGFPCLLYINDELEGVYTFNLDRYSTNSLGYDTTQFPKCLSYEISANSDTTAGAFVPWSITTGKTEREYLSADFKCRYPDNRVNGDDDFAELKRLVDWVGNATDDMFREQIEQYFNLEYLIRYYLTVQLFGLIDNLGKNTMLTTFDGNVWYMQLYDCDSCTGLDNSGAMKFDPDIEVEVGVFNTSNSRLWDKLRRNFPTQILAQWEMLRLNEFTEENIMKYLVDNISDKIPEINYNLDAWKKYITLGKDMLFACHGNRRQQIQRWIKERLIYVDTLLGYTVSTNDYITVRVNKLGEVHFDIQTFQPMYFSIKFRNEENGTGIITKRINRGETVRFSYNIPVATDQEILVYGGRFIKDLGDLSEMNPTNLILGKATRLTKVKCTNADMLINASISECAMLQEVDLHGCSNLGAGSDASLQTLDLSLCRNLRTVDISGTQLTALYTSQQGGIIQEILYPYSIQIVQVQNQARLTSLGIPCYYTGDYNDERNMFAERLSLMQVSNCPNIKTFVKNYYTNEDGSEVPVPTFIGVSKGRTFNLSNVMGHLTQIDLSYCSNIESLTLDNFYNLTEINFDDIAPYNATTSNLYNLTLTNCPNVETLTFNQNTVDGENSLGVAFKEGTVLDLSGLYNLKHIRSNVGVKGLKKLILPLTISSLVFNYPTSTTYAYGESDIEDIFSKNALHETDGFKGIDLLDIKTITDFSMGSLTKINNAINLDVKITDTFPYINYFKTDNYFKPEGTIDISEYKGSLEYLFKGVDLDKLTVVCNEPLPHTSAKYMFAYASGENVEVLNTLFGYMPNVTDFSYMFYCGYLKHAPLIPTRAENVSYMFYNNAVMETTPSNWLQAYPIIPISDYCYAGCYGIIMIDDNEGSIDVIPVAWGGFDRKNAVVSGETIIVEQTLEREFVNFTASGQTFQNIVPEVGQTPTLIANKSEQLVGEGMSNNILLVDGVMPEAELEGFTLANLASEKRSSKMTCNQAENDIKGVLNDTFIVEDGGAISQLELDGLTLVNIMPERGKTPLISNNDGQYQIDKGLDDSIILDNDKMLSAVVYGETLTNLAETTLPEPVTIGYKQNFIPNEYIENPIATEGNILMFEGNTLKNIAPKNGNTSTLSTDGLPTIEADRNLDPLYSVKDGEMPQATIKGRSYINLTLPPYLRPTDIAGTFFQGSKKSYDENTGIITFEFDSNPSSFSCNYGGLIDKNVLKPNTDYTFVVNVLENTLDLSKNSTSYMNIATEMSFLDRTRYVFTSNVLITDNQLGVKKIKATTKSDLSNADVTFGFNIRGFNTKVSFQIMIFEGDLTDVEIENWFPKGIGSVKSPTLTTVGKNLFTESLLSKSSKTIIDGEEYFLCGGVDINRSSFILDGNKIDNKKQVTFSFDIINPNNATWGTVQIKYSDYQYQTSQTILGSNRISVTSLAGKTISRIGFVTQKDFYIKNVQLEYNSKPTSYEPYKTTILATPKDLELRSEHGKQDTLDLNTGVITRYVWHDSFMNVLNNSIFGKTGTVTDSGYFVQINLGSYVGNFIGTGNQFLWGTQTCPDGNSYANGTLTGFKKSPNTGTNAESTKLGSFKVMGTYAYIHIPLEYLNGNNTYDGIKEYFADKNAEFMAAMAKPLTEQIDLSDQPKPYAYKNGYISLSSDELTPTLDYQLPSSNVFEGVSQLKADTTYTLRYDGDVTSLALGGKTINSPTSNMLVTSGSTNKNITLNGTDIDNVMLFEGDVREQDINYFTGLQTVNLNGVYFKNELFDKNAPTEKKYLDAQGNFAGGAVRTINQTIYVNNNTGLKIIYSQFQNESGGTYPSIRIGEFTENGTFIKRSLISSVNNSTYNDIFTFNVNTHYIILSIDNDYDYLGVSVCFDDLSISFPVNNIDLPQPVQLNRLPDGTCDTYNPITGEYVQRVGSKILNDGTGFYVNNTYNTDVINTLCFRGEKLPNTSSEVTIFSTIQSGAIKDEPGIHYQWNSLILRISREDLSTQDVDGLSQYLKNNPIPIFYALKEPTITQLTPININFNTENQVTILTETNAIFPKTTVTSSPISKYDTANWIPNAPITLRNATFVFINGSVTPVVASEVMSFTEEQLSSGSIVVLDNGNGLMIFNGDHTGKDIPYFTGTRSVEAIEIETSAFGSPDGMIFGKGGRK